MIDLYNNLLALSESNDAFFFADQELDGCTYRIFNYRMASYTDFLLPDAIECRGIMFEIVEGQYFRLAARPMPKFFNLNENPMTMELEITADTIESIQTKEDGSLISTYIHNGELYCKSKGSVQSDQAKGAMAYLRFGDQKYKKELQQITEDGYTVNLEYMAPTNRIVINYPNVRLTILSIRHNDTGGFLSLDNLDWKKYPTLLKEWVEEHELDPQLIFDTPEMKDTEGFVVRLRSGLTFKVKTEWYLVQHRAKDHVDSPRRLFEAAIREATDDLRSLFFDNEMVLAKIEEMDKKAQEVYTSVVSQVELFVEVNKQLIEDDMRKEYAIKGQAELDGKIFGLAMTRYQQERGIEKTLDYKEFCIKHWRDWGIKDEGTLGE